MLRDQGLESLQVHECMVNVVAKGDWHSLRGPARVFGDVINAHNRFNLFPEYRKGGLDADHVQKEKTERHRG